MRLSLFLILTFTCSAWAADLSPAETKTFLQSMQAQRAKAPTFTVDFTEEKTTHLLTKPLLSEGIVSFQMPNKFRREITGKSPSVTVSNGQKLWIYYPAFKEAELYTLGQKAFFDDSLAALTAGLNFQHLEKFFSYTATRETNGYRFQLQPRGSGLRRLLKTLSVWIGDDRKIQRTEAVLPKGDRTVTTYQNERPTPLPASAFDFAPPADAHVSQPLGK